MGDAAGTCGHPGAQEKEGGVVPASLTQQPEISMAFSPALAHRQRVLAQLSTKGMLAEHAARAGAAPPMPEDSPAASEYQTLLARLHDDLRRLHDVQSRDRKTALKRDLIAGYLPWADGVLAAPAEAAPQDDIVVHVFIWAVDIGEWDRALLLASHIIAHGLQLPERFHRTPGGLLVSEMADSAINDPGSVPHDVLLRAIPGEGPAWDMKSETLARLHRAIGESWARQAENFDPTTETAPAGGKAMLVDAALTSLREAVRLHANVGVKKLVEQLEREAKKLAAEAGAAEEQN